MQKGGLMKTRILTSLCIFFLFSTLASSADEKEYVSPNGSYIADVVYVSGSGESRVVVKAKNGRMICSKNYASKDGEHGFCVEKAAWTPDSRFFVYSMSSSGGHQPWHFPVDFCSIHYSTTRSLDDYVGPITSNDLETKPPDLVKGRSMRKNIDDQVDFEVRLSGFERQGKKK
jgi:hypothetical protein